MQVEGLYNYQKGEIVAVIDGKVQEFSILSEDTTEGFKRNYINWGNDLEPYEIVFQQERPKGVERIVEHYSCKKVLELRILEVLKSGEKNLQAYDTISGKNLNFRAS